MEKKFIVLCIAVFIGCATFCQDFRKAKWGMTVDQVKATETAKPSGEKTIGNKYVVIYPAERIAGLQCRITYIFALGKLVRAKYVSEDEHSNKNGYLDDYDSLVKALTGKYGTPTKSNTFWNNDLYKDDPSHWGMAVAVGHLSEYASWSNEKTNITASIDGDNYEITVAVEYASIELASLEGQAEKADSESKL